LVSRKQPDKVKYQFKLDGVDEDWVPVTSKTEATYSSLQPGEYTFHLKAMNNDGFWNKDPLNINLPYYRLGIVPGVLHALWHYCYSVCLWIQLVQTKNYMPISKIRKTSSGTDKRIT